MGPLLALERVYSGDGRIQEGLPRAPARLRTEANTGHQLKVFSIQKGKARCSLMSGGHLPWSGPTDPKGGWRSGQDPRVLCWGVQPALVLTGGPLGQ